MEQEEIVKGYDPEIVRRLSTYTLPFRGLVLGAALAMLISTATELLGPVILRRTIDGFILAGVPGAREGIAHNSFLLLLLLLAGLVFSFLEIYLTALAGQKVMKALRMDLYGRVIRRSLAFIGSHPTGRLVTRLTNDVETVNELFTSVLTSLAKDIFIMAGVIITLFALDPVLALATTLSLPPVLGLALYFRVKARDAFRQVRIWVSRVNSFLAEHLGGIRVIQFFTREEKVKREFARAGRALMRANLGEMYIFATFRPIIDFLSSLSLGVILYVGAVRHLGGALSLGTLVAFINLIRKFYQPVMDLSEKYTILQSAMAGSERIFQLLDDERRIPDTGREPLPQPVAGAVEFRNVSFAYKPGEPVLRGVSLSVPPGETAALVGFTGAGKSTIAHLLTRLWDPDGGTILLDGRDLRSFPLETLRRAVQPIQQDVFLFSRSIRENIDLGLGLPEEALREAARAAQIHDFIMGLPDGYDTLLHEGAVNISSGQRQLLSFARIIAHNPPVLILDEATSSIDTETEKLVQKAMTALLQGRTALVIAHRLSTVRSAHRIYVLGGGRVLEEGSHEELLARGGVYQSLHKLQTM